MAAPRTDAVAEVMAAVAGVGNDLRPLEEQSRLDAEKTRRVEALTLRLAGLSYDQIADRMHLDPNRVEQLVTMTLRRAENRAAEAQRALENERLDRAQSAIWTGVLQGDHKSISLFLQISAARRQLNGLNAPTRMEVSVGIRTEMQTALDNLERLMLMDENTVEGEVSP